MFSEKSTILIFVVIVTIFSSAKGQAFYYQEDGERQTLEHTDLENAGNCDTSSCKVSKCNCCPGYGVILGYNNRRDSCKKCDCGKDFPCRFSPGENTKSCICPLGYTEVSSVCKDKCLYIDCKNGGRCQNKNGIVVCICAHDYTGKYCETKKCSLINCENNGTCEIKEEKAVCTCTEEYTGETCQIRKCSLINCENGNCEIKEQKAVCTCTEEYTGETCTIKKCSFINCQNGGSCQIKNGDAVCICACDYTGKYCETNKCSMIKCINGGSCAVKNSKATCFCTDEYVGDYCEKQIIGDVATSATPITTMVTESTTPFETTSTSTKGPTATTTTEAFEIWIQVMKKFRMKNSKSSMNFSYHYLWNDM